METIPLARLIAQAEGAATTADEEADIEREIGGNAVKEATERGRATAFRQVADWLRRIDTGTTVSAR